MLFEVCAIVKETYPAHKLEFLCLKWAVSEKNMVMTNKPLTYVLFSAKLDFTDHRLLAALGAYDFTLKYKSGSSN